MKSRENRVLLLLEVGPRGNYLRRTLRIIIGMERRKRHTDRWKVIDSTTASFDISLQDHCTLSERERLCWRKRCKTMFGIFIGGTEFEE